MLFRSVDLGEGSVDLNAAFVQIPPAPDTYLVVERKFPPTDYRRACAADVAFLAQLAEATPATVLAR